MPVELIRFNCGGFLPGKEPLTVPPIRPPSPPIIIISPTWTSTGTALPTETPPHIPPVSGPKPTRPVLPATPIRSGGRPTTGGPVVVPIPPAPTGPIPTVGTTGTAGTTGGTTNPSRYRCTEVLFWCPNDPPEQRRLREVKRYCTACTQIHNEFGELVWPNDCTHTTRQRCLDVCRDSPILNNCADPIFISTEVTQQTNFQSTTNIPPVRTEINSIHVFQQAIREVESNLSGTELVVLDPVEMYPTQTNVVNNHSPSNPDGNLYSTKYNIFEASPDHKTSMVTNTVRTDVFGNIIASEVAVFLQENNSEWNESQINNLTVEKIGISLNTNLFRSLAGLHDAAHIRIPIQRFLEMIRKHLLEGTLDYFDSAYYHSLANRQRTSQLTAIKPHSNRAVNERAAIQLLAKEAISANYSVFGETPRRQIQRQRRLLTDVEATIPLCLDGGVGSTLPLYDAGVCIKGRGSVPMGPGYKYQISTLLTGDDCEYLELNTQIDKALYAPVKTRLTALALMNEDSSFRLSVGSSSGSHEFTSSSIPEFDTSPQYYRLVLSSIEDMESRNPLVNRTSCRFELITDQSEIDYETKNIGFSVSRIAIPFDDPLFRYCVETSGFTFEQNDITFRNFQSNRTLVGNAILTRNIPFGIVLTPVNGSRYNPFGGNSRIESYSNDVVKRSVTLIPDIDVNSNEYQNPTLEDRNLYLETGSYQVGPSEEVDPQNKFYRFSASSSSFVNSFFSAGVYGSSVPQIENYGYAYLVTNVISSILLEDNPEEITWWDVYSRLTRGRFAELMFDGNPDLHTKLSNGLVGGMKIKNVLAIYNEDDVTILDTSNTVLNSENRA